MKTFLCALVAAAALSAAPTAAAEHIALAVAFPCTAQATSGANSASLSCDAGGANFSVVVSKVKTDATEDDIYRNSINDLAASLQGQVSGLMPYASDGVRGRDVQIDLTGQHMVMHARTFIAHGLYYAISYVGPAGSENGKAVTEFLNSFRLPQLWLELQD